jgi:hypothetical protein
MKRTLYFLLILLLVGFTSCYKNDNKELEEQVKSLKEQVLDLMQINKKMIDDHLSKISQNTDEEKKNFDPIYQKLEEFKEILESDILLSPDIDKNNISNFINLDQLKVNNIDDENIDIRSEIFAEILKETFFNIDVFIDNSDNSITQEFNTLINYNTEIVQINEEEYIITEYILEEDFEGFDVEFEIALKIDLFEEVTQIIEFFASIGEGPDAPNDVEILLMNFFNDNCKQYLDLDLTEFIPVVN